MLLVTNGDCSLVKSMQTCIQDMVGMSWIEMRCE